MKSRPGRPRGATLPGSWRERLQPGCGDSIPALLLPVFVFLIAGWTSFTHAEPLHCLAIVSADYQDKANLGAWKSTFRVIDRCLKSRWKGAYTSSMAVNPALCEIRPLLQELASRQGCRILYIGGHMEGDARLQLVSGEDVYPNVLAQGLTIQDRPLADLVIWDTCFAGSAAYQEVWMKAARCPHLFVADTIQKTWEVDFRSRYPLEFGKRFPRVETMLTQCLESDWNRKVSFLGFRFAWSWLEQTPEPVNEKSLLEFFMFLPTHQPDLRKLKFARKGSTLIWWEAGRMP